MAKRNGSFPESVQSGVPQLSSTPEGWSRVPLGKYLTEIKRPVDMKDDQQYKLVTVKRSRGGAEERGVTLGRDIKVKSQFYVEPNDFLISKRQIVHGACALVPQHLDGAIVSNEYSVLGTNGKFDLNFLKYMSNSIYFQQTCFHSSIGVHVEKMIFKLNRWLKWDFNIPPLPEQKKIARILSTWDKAIETVDNLIENSQQQKKALMQQLLTGKKRLPGFSGEWKKVKLENILSSLDAGVSVNSEDRRICEGEKGILKTSCVSNGAFDPQEHKAVSDPSETARLKESVQKDCIIVSRMNTPLLVGANAYIEQDYPSLFLPDRLWQLKPKSDSFSMRWLGYVFSSPTMRDKLREIGTGTSGSMKNITKGDVMSLVVYAPPLPEQKSIALVLSTCDKEIECRKAIRDQCQTQKQALMQQLLTGKRRVKVTE